MRIKAFKIYLWIRNVIKQLLRTCLIRGVALREERTGIGQCSPNADISPHTTKGRAIGREVIPELGPGLIG